ncbi:MAG: hypothetical protein J6O55_06660 [Lachnospiraceae bacterium]|nr:hypothetical protein [Lachnospiraceae bacterium]
MLFLPLASIFLFGLILRRAIKKNNAAYEKIKSDFWDREREADRAPAASIFELAFIEFPEELPLDMPIEDTAGRECQDTLKRLSDKQILNLTGLSNTDLKLKYGAANLEDLSRADENFTVLSRMLPRLAKSYMSEGFVDEALKLLLFGVECLCDSREIWELLGEHYLEKEDRAALEDLCGKARELPESASKNYIIKKMDEYLALLDAVSGGGAYE